MIFVTGATGFIGQRLVERLIAQGERLKILSRSHQSEHEVVVCDLQREIIPDGALDGVDTVFHLAGFAHDLSDPSVLEEVYRKLNVDVTIRLAELAIRAGVKRFVFISSVKASSSEGIYGKTKREAELRLLEITQQPGGNLPCMHVVILRPALVYGPGVKGNLQLMYSGVEKGWFPPLPETGNQRSMIHVDNLVQAMLLVAEDRRANGEIFIATDGKCYSSREIFEAMCRVAGKAVPIWSVPKFLFELAGLVGARLRYKVDKLLGNECYSSEKLEALGFKAERSLKDWK